MSRVVFLGPQRFRPTLAGVLDRFEIEGTVAAVTAGWQEREQEVDELKVHIHRDLVNLGLYERTEQVLASDPEFGAALHDKQRRLRDLQKLYRQRLGHTLKAAREVMCLDGRDAFVQEHRQAAVRAVRTLDRQHLIRVRRIHSEFDEQWAPATRPSVDSHRRELEDLVAGASAVAIAGGHVAILVNRLRLFRFAELLAPQTVVAWSAGAMALSERVVLFHDRPPQGAGDAEVLDAGLGVVDGIVALPHARSRLDLEDPVRVALLARRFAPDLLATLDAGTELIRDGGRWMSGAGARALTSRGAVVDLKHP